MNKKYFPLLLFFLLLSFFNSAFAECRFGLLVSVSGDYASGGQECLYGHEVAVQKYATQKLPIKFFLEDSKAQGKESVNLFKKLVEVDRVQAIELVRSPVGMAVNPLSLRMKIPILGAVAHPKFTAENPYAYQIWPTPDKEAGLLAKIMINDGVKNIYSLTSEDDWLLAFQDGLVKNFTALGGAVLVKENVEPSFLDFRSLIYKIKRANPDSIFIGLAPNQLGIFIKQLRDAGIDQKVYTTFMLKFEDVIGSLNNDLLDNLAFVEADVMRPNFQSDYQKVSKGQIASAISYSCYLTSEALYQACSEHLNTQADFQTIFTKMSVIENLDEPVRISAQKADFTIAAYQFIQGKLTPIKE